MPKNTHAGSGVAVGAYAVDCYREGTANRAANVLECGGSVLSRSADHLSAAELCIEAIVRQANNAGKRGSNLTEAIALPQAVANLRNGDGHHKAQADHSGGNTCAQVLAAAINV